jgi:hypothetical protein
VPTHIGGNHDRFPDEVAFDPSAAPEGMPAEEVDIESIMRSFWWPEPFDTTTPGNNGTSLQLETMGLVPHPGVSYRPSPFPASEFSQTSTMIPSYIPSSSATSKMNTGFDPSLGAPFHQLQQPVFQNPASANMQQQQQRFPITSADPNNLATATTTSSGLGIEEFALFGSAGATAAMLDPLIGFLHEEPFYGV